MAKEKGPTKAELKKLANDIKKSSKEKNFNQRDLMTWLFDGGSCEPPNFFLRRETYLKDQIKYMTPKFRTLPKVMNFFNEHLNRLYDRRTGSEILEFLKSYIQMHKIQPEWLDSTWYGKDQRESFFNWHKTNIGTLETTEGDILEEYQMYMSGAFNENPVLINKWAGIYSDPNNIPEDFEDNVLELMGILEETKHDNDPRFLKELDQTIVDDLALSLIDIKMLEKQNKILLIFIDKNNNKKYLLKPFTFEFVISNLNSIKYNDYIVQFDPNYHTYYVCTDYFTMEKIRMAINKSRDKFFHKFGWL